MLRTKIGDSVVSTVRSGAVYETRVFGGSLDEEMDVSLTKEEALRVHQVTVNAVKEADGR